MLNINKCRHRNNQMNQINELQLQYYNFYGTKIPVWFWGALQSVHKQLKITSINFQIYKYKRSSMKKGNKSLVENVLLKRNIFNLFLKISTQGRGVFLDRRGVW